MLIETFDSFAAKVIGEKSTAPGQEDPSSAYLTQESKFKQASFADELVSRIIKQTSRSRLVRGA